MARKLQQKLQKVSVYIRIRLTDGSQPYCPAIWESKKRLRPHWCLVHGKPEHHPEGVYHVRYRVNGKPVWEKVCVGDDHYGAADLAALRQSQLADPQDAFTKRIVDEQKPEPAEAGPAKQRLDDEVKTYLQNVEKLSRRTHSAYRRTLDLFRQSCGKVAIEIFDQSPRDGTNTWLVWNMKLDRAELWRSCDLSRILRTNGKVKQNKCRYNSYWCLGPNGQSRWFLAMYHARQRLDGLKRGETADEFWKRADFSELTEEQMMDIYDNTPIKFICTRRKITINSETAKRIAQLLERRENAKHVIAGEVIDGKIKVWDRCKEGDPLLVEATDGSIVWLVERLIGKYAGRADLWRACDIRRLKRGLQPKLNKCETVYSTDDVGWEVEQGMAYWNERLERAEERLAELKHMDTTG